MIMKIKFYLYTPRTEESKGRFKVHIPEDHLTSRRIRNLEGIIHPLNVTHVIICDTLLDISLLRKISSRRRTKSSMPMKMNKMNQTRKGPQRMNTLV